MTKRFVILASALLALAACDQPTQKLVADQVAQLPAPPQAKGWNGTIVIAENGITDWDDSTAAETTKSNLKQLMTATITVKNGKAEAEISYSLKIHTDHGSDDEISKQTGMTDSHTKGTGTSTAKVNITFYEDGTYGISWSAFGIKGVIEESSSRTTQCHITDPKTCNAGTVTTSKSDPIDGLGTLSGDVSGKVNGKPDELTGSEQSSFEIRPGVNRIGTITWNLKR